MARKVDPTEDTTPPAPGADDLAVLYPELPLTIAGEAIVVREYGFIEGLRLRPTVAAFVADLGVLMRSQPIVEDVYDLLGTHVDAIQLAIAVSISRDVEWVRVLNDKDGDQLVQTWWTVCGPFFMRQLVRRAYETALAKGRTTPNAGETSSPPSSPADSAPSSSSASAPNAS